MPRPIDNAYLQASFAVQRKDAPSSHIRCMITASLRATATFAFLSELRLAIATPQFFNAVHWVDRLSMTLAAANSALRVRPSPVLAMRPRRSTSPDWYCRGASPR